MRTGHERHDVLLEAEPVLFYATLQKEMTLLDNYRGIDEIYALDFLGGGTLLPPGGSLKED